MKKLLFSLLMVSLAASMWAGNLNRSELRISLYDGSAFNIAVGNMVFNKQATSYTIQNLAPGEHFVEILKTERFRDRHGRWIVSNSLVFADYVYFRGATSLLAEIDRRGRFVVIAEFSHLGNMRDDRHRSNKRNHSYSQSRHTDSYSGQWSLNQNSTMNQHAFAALLSTLSNSSFDSDKLEIAKQALAWNHVTAMQVRQIIAVFSFESSKLEIAKFAFGSTIDPENYFIVHNAFSFSSSSRELNSYIAMVH